MTTKQNKKITQELFLNKKLSFENISISIKKKDVFEQISKKIVPSYSTKNSIGAGVFKYEGSSWEENSIFLGWCDALGAGVLKFIGKNSSLYFEDFRKMYLIEENKENFLFLGFQATGYCSIALSQIVIQGELENLFQKTSQSQLKKQPKVSIQKGNLVLGSSNSGNSISFSPILLSNSNVSNLKCTMKFSKDSKFFDFLRTNTEIFIGDILVYVSIQTISKLTLTGILVDVKNSFIENNKINLIIDSKSSDKPSKDGATVLRSLSAVKNKLINPFTTNESKKIFLSWLAAILNSYKDDEMFKEFLKTFQLPLKEGEQISSASRGRSRKESENS